MRRSRLAKAWGRGISPSEEFKKRQSRGIFHGDISSRFSRVAGSAAAATVGAFSTAAKAAMGPSDKFDLVIKGGDVLDPSQSLRGKRDIGIRWGMVEAIEAEIPAARALKTLDATGKLTAECCQSPFSVR
jgi:hypothetical protein